MCSLFSLGVCLVMSIFQSVGRGIFLGLQLTTPLTCLRLCLVAFVMRFFTDKMPRRRPPSITIIDPSAVFHDRTSAAKLTAQQQIICLSQLHVSCLETKKVLKKV